VKKHCKWTVMHNDYCKWNTLHCKQYIFYICRQNRAERVSWKAIHRHKNETYLI